MRRAGGDAHFPKDTHLNGKVHASPAEAPSSPISAGTRGLPWMSHPLGLAACPGANTSPARLRPFITGMKPSVSPSRVALFLQDRHDCSRFFTFPCTFDNPRRFFPKKEPLGFYWQLFSFSPSQRSLPFLPVSVTLVEEGDSAAQVGQPRPRETALGLYCPRAAELTRHKPASRAPKAARGCSSNSGSSLRPSQTKLV